MTKIVCFESKKHFFRIVRFGKIVCFSPKDRLLWLKRSSAFEPKIVCFQQDRLLSTLPVDYKIYDRTVFTVYEDTSFYDYNGDLEFNEDAVMCGANRTECSGVSEF